MYPYIRVNIVLVHLKALQNIIIITTVGFQKPVKHWCQDPLWLSNSRNAQVPYIKWHSIGIEPMYFLTYTLKNI